MNSKERFEKLLKEIFIGVKIKGDSAIANLLTFKSKYYESFIYNITQKIYKTNASQEIYDKLYDFFSSYFNESGSLFFANTPKWQKKYARLSNKDVELFYKTRDLYYIKTQKVFNPLNIKVDEFSFRFNIDDLGDRKGNEKKEIEFLFINFDKEKKLIEFKVKYKQNEDYTALKKITGLDKPDKIRKYLFENLPKEIKYKKNYVFENLDKLKAKDIDLLIYTKEQDSLFEDVEVEFNLKDINAITKIVNTNKKEKLKEEIKEAFRVYKKQSSIDYFIHKNAKEFLKEQFDLYMFDYIKGEIFDEKRLKTLKNLKDIAYELIEKIAKFENELKAIYLKPRIVFDSNYVITKDKLEEYEILDKFLTHSGIEEQIGEWKELKLVDEDFELNQIEDEKYKYLPFDTKYFKSIEIDLLEKIDNLDDELDGRVIHSENFQALNTLLPKFRNEIDLIYIDPPYNAPSSEIVYINRFKHSTWLTMMENRISLAKEFLKKDGFHLAAIDDIELRYFITLLDNIFDIKNYVTTFAIEANPQGRVSNKVSKTNEFTIFHIKNIENVDKIYFTKLENTKPAPLRRGGTNSKREERPNRYYPILIKNNKIFMITKEEYKKIYDKVNKKFNDDFVNELRQKYEALGYKFVLPMSESGEKLVWQRTFERVEKEKDTYIIKNNKIYTPVLNIEIPKTLLRNGLYANPKYGSEYLKNLLGEVKFETPKSYHTIKQFITMKNNRYSFILDFFAGSGTTADAIIRLNKEDGGKRKFLLIEMGEHFNNVILPRIKKLCVSLNYKQGYPQDREGNSLFFKYSLLEQYEDILKKAKYSDNLETSPKLTFAITIENEKAKIDLNKIYPNKNIDIAETMSNLLGKKIKKITKDKICLENKEIDLKNFTFENYPEVKKLIYWE